MSSFVIAEMKVLVTETEPTTAHPPQKSGQFEWCNRAMATQLRRYVTDDPRRWDELAIRRRIPSSSATGPIMYI